MTTAPLAQVPTAIWMDIIRLATADKRLAYDTVEYHARARPAACMAVIRHLNEIKNEIFNLGDERHRDYQNGNLARSDWGDVAVEDFAPPLELIQLSTKINYDADEETFDELTNDEYWDEMSNWDCV